MTHAFVVLAGFCALNLVAGLSFGQPATEPVTKVKPAVYLLIAAVGEDFSVVYEVQTTGTHLAPYRRETSKVPNNLLNRLALNGLDAAIAKIDPDSKRVYAAFSAFPMDGVAPTERGTVAIGRIVSALESVPQRPEWDKIVIAVPAYRALAVDGVASKLQGFGIFSEPLCQGGCGGTTSLDAMRALNPEPPDGVDVVTSEDKTIKARTYLAPFSHIEIWILDPKTLAVLDRQQGFDNQKLAEPQYKSALDPSQPDTQQYLVGRIARLIEFSVGEAVRRSEVNRKRPKVEVGDIKEIKPDEISK